MDLKKKAIAIGVNVNNQPDYNDTMEELSNLIIACDLDVVAEVVQNLRCVTPSHYIGKGKIPDILSKIEKFGANLVIFNDELSSTQVRNLELVLNCKVIDRTKLILEIFAQRAKTKEAKLQVEIAHLQYMLPRLIGSGESMDRQRGGSGARNKGTGESKLELDRRKIENKISLLKKELDIIVTQRRTQRSKRKKNKVPIISLIGYTNAGKSTILNTLVDSYNQASNKKVTEKDMLFTTLETSVRHIQMPDNKNFFITDTVGFVRNLPHHLVEAFRSTLEESAASDLLIHVVDYSHSNYIEFIETTNSTLREIGIDNIPIILVFNKSDLMDINIPKSEDNHVFISAKHGIGIDMIIDLIRNYLFQDYKTCTMRIPYTEGNLVHYFNEYANILSTSYENEGTTLTMECTFSDYEKYKKYIHEDS
ncbi:GTPase HflX [Paenibacillus sp. FSL H3-0457]|uniref:GTPase HflX n=1 Tax=Paenibacillus sp. FSL H3-0457 TaxID=2921430 RepID=UPI0030EC0204